MNDNLKKVKTTSKLNLREKPNIDSNIIEVINKGDNVLLISYGEDWSKVIYKGKVGFVSSKYLNIENKQTKSIIEVQPNQKSAFNNFGQAYLNGSVVAFFLIWLIFYRKSQIRDRRYNSGYRQDDLLFAKYTIKSIPYLIIGTPILGLIIRGILYLFDFKLF